MKTNKIVSTKTTLVEKDAEGKVISKAQGAPIKTNLTIDWEGCSPEDILAMAQAALIVKLQGGWRSNGTPEKIEVKAADHKVGVRVPKGPPTPEQVMASLDSAGKAALLARLLAEQG